MKKTVKTFDGNCIITEMKAAHGKSGDMKDYLMFSDGMNAVGFYLDKNTKKEIAKALTTTGTEENKRGRGRPSGNN
jgi:hypothetical protein